jgi:hypothetical protein
MWKDKGSKATRLVTVQFQAGGGIIAVTDIGLHLYDI